MDYRSNQYYPPVDNNSFGEPNAINNYSSLSQVMAPKHYNSYANPVSHPASPMNNDNFDGVPISHNYGSFHSQREIIITSHYQDSESSPKSKRYRSKSRSPSKFSPDIKKKRPRRRRRRKRKEEPSTPCDDKSRSVEIKKESPNYKDDYYSFPNKHQSESTSTYNKNFVHQQDGVNYDSSSKLSIQVKNQHSDNSSSKNRYLPKTYISLAQNLDQAETSSNSSLESSPLDNQPGYYLNYPCTKKNMVIENPFSGALYLQNIQNRDDINNTSEVPQFNTDTSAFAKGVEDNYEKQDMQMQRSGGHREEFSQNIHSMPYVKKSLSVVSVSSDSKDNLDSAFNFHNNPNEQIFPQHNEASFSGNLISSGQDNRNEHLHSFSSRDKYMPMENATYTSQSMIDVGNLPEEMGQGRGNYMDENSLDSQDDVQYNMNDDNRDHDVIPDFNSDTSKLTPEEWTNLIEEMSMKRGWNDDDKRYMMTSRLRGLASKWYLSKGINYKTWPSLKNMFIRAFPTKIEYYCLLKRMMLRKKQNDETIANYFHHKVALLNACEIYNKRAVSCIIYGIPNIHLANEAKLQNFTNIDSLYSFLRTCYSKLKDVEQNRNSPSKVEQLVTTEVSKYKAVKSESSRVIKTTGVKIKTVKVSKSYNGSRNRCFRCGSPNHLQSTCTNPPWLHSCSRCGRSSVKTKRCGCKLLKMFS